MRARIPKSRRVCWARAAWIAGLVVATASCSAPGDPSDPGQECWLRDYHFGSLSDLRSGYFDLDHCLEAGELDGEVIYRCFCTTGCLCGYEPPPAGTWENWGCRWLRDAFYVGPETNFHPLGACECQANFPCWARCCGRPGPDGGLGCEHAGAVRPCQETPELDEDGRGVFCHIGVGVLEFFVDLELEPLCE